jgi:hypothetical protein
LGGLGGLAVAFSLRRERPAWPTANISEPGQPWQAWAAH